MKLPSEIYRTITEEFIQIGYSRLQYFLFCEMKELKKKQHYEILNEVYFALMQTKADQRIESMEEKDRRILWDQAREIGGRLPVYDKIKIARSIYALDILAKIKYCGKTNY